MRILLLGALLALPAAAQVPSSNSCSQKPRPVLLQAGLHIDVVYCSNMPEIEIGVEQGTPKADGTSYTIVGRKIRRADENSAGWVLLYKPHGEWTIPAHDVDSLGAKLLQQGSLDTPDHTGWVTKKDFRLDHRGQDWLEARQIVLHKPAGNQWVYFRIIRDTRHNLLYLLYQRDATGGATEENSFFQSFTVNPNSFAVDVQEPGAHLAPPYPNL